MIHELPLCVPAITGYFATESYRIPESEKQEDAEMMHVGTEIDESVTGPFDIITSAEQVIPLA